MNKTILWVLVVIIIVALGAWAAFGMHKSAMAPATATTTAMSDMTATTTTDMAMTASTTAVTITYTDSGFSPSVATVPAGAMVTWVNQSSENLWVASDPHPVHTGYDGTSVREHCVSGAPTGTNVFDSCTMIPKGGTFSFMPLKVGSWGYHNHANDSVHATLVVTAANAAQ